MKSWLFTTSAKPCGRASQARSAASRAAAAASWKAVPGRMGRSNSSVPCLRAWITWWRHQSSVSVLSSMDREKMMFSYSMGPSGAPSMACSSPGSTGTMQPASTG